MEKMLDSAEKQVLVDAVKSAQKERKKGSKGDWKAFLKAHDLQLGTCVCDPQKRSRNDLIAFLKTLPQEEFSKKFSGISRCYSNRKAAQEFAENSADNESPAQKLVRLTLEHPEYPLTYSFPSDQKEWVTTKVRKLSKAVKSDSLVAIDCEMVLCEDGTQAVVQVCVVDRNLEVKLNELVNPNKPVADYRTDITGICAKDLEGVTCSLIDIQKSLKNLLSRGTILIGHALNNDLQALKLNHARVIDTALIFKNLDGSMTARPSLNYLCKTVLGFELRRKDSSHDCLADASAAMKLVLAKLEHGFDDGIPLPSKIVPGSSPLELLPLPSNDVPDSSPSELLPLPSKVVPDCTPLKLLLHSIPTSVRRNDLEKLYFPKDFNVELQTIDVEVVRYSVVANFKDPQEMHNVFEQMGGEEVKDSLGRPQKLVSLPTHFGVSGFYVRKVLHDNEIPIVSIPEKTLKTKSQLCEEHIEEIDRLKRELRERDEELLNLQKNISDLRRKHCGYSLGDGFAQPPSKKRQIERDETITEVKKPKTDPNQCEHMKDIRQLKKELRERDDEYVNLDRIVSALVRKHGL